MAPEPSPISLTPNEPQIMAYPLSIVIAIAIATEGQGTAPGWLYRT